MNRRFEQRLRRLEEQQATQLGTSTKRWLPEWLLDAWLKDTGLPYDTNERARDSMERVWQSQRKGGACQLPNSEHRAPGLLDGSTRPLSGAP
jgi:hypothetical protein